MTNKLVKELCEKLLILLQSEKEALIHNDSEKIEEVVSKKEEIVSAINEIELDEINQEDELIALIKEIKEKQERNLMLTKQAMNYTGSFISAFQNEANKNITYSKEGKDSKAKSSLLNQSL